MNVIRNSLTFRFLMKLYSIYMNSGIVKFIDIVFTNIKFSFITTHIFEPLNSDKLEKVIRQ